MNFIDKSFSHGNNFKIGHFCVIEDDVVVGDNVKIGNHVFLKSGTKIGNDTFIDTGVISSGNNRIGNSCKIRYQSIIARNVLIGDNVYFSAGVKTIFLTHTGGESIGMEIGSNCFFGDNVTIMGGISIVSQCSFGACTLITKHIWTPGLYIGTPARFLRSLREEEIYK